MRRTTDVTIVLFLLVRELHVCMIGDNLHGSNTENTDQTDLLFIGHLQLHDCWNRQTQQQHISHNADDRLRNVNASTVEAYCDAKKFRIPASSNGLASKE